MPKWIGYPARKKQTTKKKRTSFKSKTKKLVKAWVRAIKSIPSKVKRVIKNSRWPRWTGMGGMWARLANAKAKARKKNKNKK